MHPSAMPFSPRTHLDRRVDARGFALLITITLLAFLVLLLVSLASLTRVETQVAANSIQIEQARQNALTGLQIALGQLQKYAGPDQRITVPATTVYPEKNVSTATGKLFETYRARAKTAQRNTFLTAAERTLWETDLRSWWNTGNRNPYWTAVFDSSLRRDSATVGKYGEFKRDQLPVWLVSGNERFSFDPATATSYPSGYLTPDIDLSSLVSDPAKDIIELVSADSAKDAGDHIAPHKDNSVDGLSGTVRVVRQPLTGTPVGAASPQTIGHYAYWVADESTKANFSVRDPWYSVTARSTSDYRNRLQVPQRVGWERMTGFAEAYDNHTTSVALNDPKFEKAVAHQQLPLIDTAFAAPVKRNFHHLTTYSRSIQTDTALGGLKKDLTVFAEGTGSGVSTAATVFDRSLYAATDPRFGSSNTGFPKTSSTTNLPVWGQLKDWVDSEAINVSSAVPVTKNRGPILSNAQFFYGFSREGNRIQMHFIPMVVLWNPYDAALAPTDYTLKWRVQFAYEDLGVATRANTELTAKAKAIADANPDLKNFLAKPTAGKYSSPAAGKVSVITTDNWANINAYLDAVKGGIMEVPYAANSSATTPSVCTDYFIHPLRGVDWYAPGSSLYRKKIDAASIFGHSSSTGLYLSNAFDLFNTRARPANAQEVTNDGITWFNFALNNVGFEAGQAKVFVIGDYMKVNASDLHASTYAGTPSKTIPLVSDGFQNTSPPSVYFDIAEISDGYNWQDSDEVRWYSQYFAAYMSAWCSMSLSSGGNELWMFRDMGDSGSGYSISLTASINSLVIRQLRLN